MLRATLPKCLEPFACKINWVKQGKTFKWVYLEPGLRYGEFHHVAGLSFPAIADKMKDITPCTCFPCQLDLANITETI
jgi:hypothetical protein